VINKQIIDLFDKAGRAFNITRLAALKDYAIYRIRMQPFF